MAKNPAPPEQPAPAAKNASEKATGFSMKKMIMIGIPVFLVQVVLIYFVVTKFLAPASASAGGHSAPTKGESEHAPSVSEEEVTQNIHIVKDLIVNPAGTNGTRFLLTTVGFSVTTPEAKLELENKDMQVRDVLNTILTSKDLAELSSTAERESLRTEITKKVAELVRRGALTNVYFSKFIIQ
jgi:flagellar protein FliL